MLGIILFVAVVLLLGLTAVEALVPVAVHRRSSRYRPVTARLVPLQAKTQTQTQTESGWNLETAFKGFTDGLFGGETVSVDIDNPMITSTI